jgi:hypothetical protein
MLAQSGFIARYLNGDIALWITDGFRIAAHDPETSS